ncbi:MAG TPA: thioesterase family protein [Xanthobacteraceae bacterium]|jgi:fluoroacetyl-CoA thioesterase|nr:thioesterase family protein [Xanthobacteraceae bacterium]
MKPSLAPGLRAVHRIVVDRAKTIGLMGEEGRVYATPYLIGDIEMTCRNLILAHADAGEDSVGMEVAIRHLAATLPGMTVEITVEVTAVEGRKVVFGVTAKDDLDTISSGSHARFVVDAAKTIERLEAKAVKLAARAST